MLRKVVASCAGAVALSVTALVGPAGAQQTGLVNIELEVSRNNIAVQVPVAAAANICGVDVNVLAVDLADDNRARCDADANNTVELVQRQR